MLCGTGSDGAGLRRLQWNSELDFASCWEHHIPTTRCGRSSQPFEIRHKQHRGLVKLSKNSAVCRASVSDQSGGLKLIGEWASWLGSNASDLIAGRDVRFE